MSKKESECVKCGNKRLEYCEDCTWYALCDRCDFCSCRDCYEYKK